MKALKYLSLAIAIMSMMTVAQANDRELLKVKNWARQAAEKANGGLSKYRAVASMYDNRDGSACSSESSTIYDRFYVCEVLGGKPAREVQPEIRTIVEIGFDGNRWNIEVVSNGSNSGDDDYKGPGEKTPTEPRPAPGDKEKGSVKDFKASLESLLDDLSDYEVNTKLKEDDRRFPFFEDVRYGLFDLLDLLDTISNGDDLEDKRSEIKKLADNLEDAFDYATKSFKDDDFLDIEDDYLDLLDDFSKLLK